MTGFRAFDDRFKNPLWDPNKIFTVSDEAFALVTLENHFDHWLALLKHHSYNIPPARSMSGTKKRKQEEISETPRYTSGGITYGNMAEADLSKSKSKGWSTEGINRFNELYELVIADRENFPNFNVNFCARAREPRVNLTVVPKKPSKKPQARYDSFLAFEQQLVLSDTTNLGEVGSTFFDNNKEGDPRNCIHDNVEDEQDNEEEDNEDRVSDASSAAVDSSDDEGIDENAQAKRVAVKRVAEV